jgi:hypothetical protein
MGRNGELEKHIVGPVRENGKDLPSGKDYGTYVIEKGRIYVLTFLRITRSSSPPYGS